MAEREELEDLSILLERRRTVADAEGNPWDVREVRNPDYDQRGGYSLIFETTSVVRRVRLYPENWFTLPAAELFALSARP